MGWLGRWFWVPVRDGENSAQTLVRVLGNLFRIALSITLVGVVIVAGFAAYYSNVAARLNAAKQDDERAIAVIVKLTQPDDHSVLCSDSHPLIVFVINRSQQALMSMSIRLSAREAGSSTDKLNPFENDIHWDAIVPPGYEYYECWSVGAEHRQLKFSGAAQSHTVKLESVQPWMLKETKAWKVKAASP